MLFIQRVEANVAITSQTNGQDIAMSDIFELSDEQGNNISTNSHYKFLNFWYNAYGKFAILWQGDKQAYSRHKPQNITIAGKTISQVYEYQKFTITDKMGNTVKEYNSQGQYHYFVTYLEYNEVFTDGFNINIDTGAGGFNVNTDAKVKFYILVQHNVGGNISTDWEQSKGNIAIGQKYSVCCKEYTRAEYKDANITYPNNSAEIKLQEIVEVVGTEGVTKIVFNYDTSTTRDIIINKNWDDNQNSGNTRPDKIRIYLTIDNKETSIYYDLDSINEVSHTFQGIQKYDDNNNIINYGIKEKEINQGELKKYKSTVKGNMQNGFTIENTLLKDYIDTIDIKINAPDKIKSSDEKINYTIEFSFSVSEGYEEDIINFSIKDILKYKIDLLKENNFDGGKYNQEENTIVWNGSYNKVTKTITWDDGKEEIIDNKIISVQKVITVFYKDLIINNNTNIDNKVIGNTYLIDSLEKQAEDNVTTLIDFYIDIIINKQWENDVSYDKDGNEIISGLRPDKIIFRLLDGNDFIQDIEITKDNNWTDTLKRLPKYNETTGKEINYNLIELDIPIRYNCNIKKDVSDGEIIFNVTNKKISEITTLPETGGIGVIITDILGMILILTPIIVHKYRKMKIT